MALQRLHRHPRRISRHDLLPLLRSRRYPSRVHTPLPFHRHPVWLSSQIRHDGLERQLVVRGAERGILDDGERVDLLPDFERVVQSGYHARDGG